MTKLRIDEAKEKLATLINQVASKGETIIIQTAEGVSAALVRLADLPRAELSDATLNSRLDMESLAAADAIRSQILVRRNGQPLADASQDIELLRELRLLELQGMH